ncbi:Uncharacterised protein [Candidatus Ornithobacterium hominis]|nr:hypothetical protein [Candidatus Ornithobacterium hominis]SZD73226.1 Uncharacterised protein [Candidatus Ornithobacterium hominis]
MRKKRNPINESELMELMAGKKELSPVKESSSPKPMNEKPMRIYFFRRVKLRHEMESRYISVLNFIAGLYRLCR